MKSQGEAKFVEELAEMERRLNDVRREHTKAGRMPLILTVKSNCLT